ncbi:MAG: S41 family peptidase [Vicinamibacterales bacterium]
MTSSDAARRRIARGLVAIVVTAAAVSLSAQAPLTVETFDAVWRIVRDSHFDKTLNGVDWESVATELRPRAARAHTAGELRAVLKDMLGRLGQSHFAIIPATSDRIGDAPRDQSATPGFDVRLVGDDVLVTRVDAAGGGAAAGVQAGWKVNAIDGLPVARLVGSLPETLEERFRQVEAWRLAQSRLRGPSGAPVRITFEDDKGGEVLLAIERRPESGQPVTVGSLPTMFVRVDAREVETPGGRPVGVVGFNVWMTAVDAKFQQAIDEFRGKAGVVVDLRGNPGGLAGMLMGISGHFIDERIALGVMKMRHNEELRFNVNPRRVNGRGERVDPFGGPVAILVDSLSGSASECFTGGMQSLGRARVFGQRTMGQALPALFDRLPNGDVLIHAFGDFVTADGTRLEGRGVIPDEVVPLDRAALLAGRDGTLEAALEWIDRAAGSRAALR